MHADAWIGEEIGNHRIMAKIARGGFGTVYRAEHIIEQLKDHVVAIKILRTDRIIPDAHERFLQEAYTLFRLKHQYILPFNNAGEHEGHLYLMTDYAANGSLQGRICLLRPPDFLSLQEVLTILSQVGAALQYIHQQNIIHCDLKPENVLFDAQGTALLADFGIAKIAAAVGMEKDEKTGRGTGTPEYMAPEQFQGTPTPRSDQYAFACTAYKILTLRTPFIGSSPIDLYQQHLKKQPPDPRVFNPQVPEYMAQALLKALAKDPDSRYTDMNTLLAALRIPLDQKAMAVKPEMSEKTKEELLDKGTAFFQDGYFDDALKIYNDLINQLGSEPVKAKVYCGQGDVLIKQSKNKLVALAAYNQALSIDPKSIPAHIGIGNALYLLQDLHSAVDAYQKAVQLAPVVLLYQKIANIYIELEEYNEALAAYNEAMYHGADPVEILHKKIGLLIDRHRYREVAKEYDTLIQLSPHPLAVCEEKRNFLFDILHSKVRKLPTDEDFAINQILATYDQIFKLKQKDLNVYYEEIIDLENRIANISKRLTIFEMLSNRVPDDIKVHVYYKMADLLKKLNRLHESLAVYNRIIERVPDDIKACSEKLVVFEQMEWPKDSRENALNTCDQILKQVPEDLHVHYKRLILLELLKRYDQVVDESCQILNLAHSSADTLHRRGKAYEKLESTDGNRKKNILGIRFTPVSLRYLRALADYDQACTIDPDNPEYHKSRKELLKRLKKFNPVEKAPQSITRRHPALSWLSWSLPFLLLPTFINTVFGMIILLFAPRLSILEIVVGALCISIFVVCLISISEKESLIRQYHLYNAFILFWPTSCFAIGWLITSLLILHLGVSRSFILLFVSFFVNAYMYIQIDIYEESIFALIWGEVSKTARWACKMLLKILGALVEAYLESVKKRREYPARQEKAIIAIQNTPSAKTAPGRAVVSQVAQTKQKSQLKPVKCWACQGKKTTLCPRCKGKRYQRKRRQSVAKSVIYLPATCALCKGIGRIARLRNCYCYMLHQRRCHFCATNNAFCVSCEKIVWQRSSSGAPAYRSTMPRSTPTSGSMAAAVQ